MKHYYFMFIVSVLFSCGKTQSCIDYDKVNITGVCSQSYDPVCGCDDIEYRNQCYAEIHGVISWIGGPCP